MVASSQEEEKDLTALMENGRANGVEGQCLREVRTETQPLRMRQWNDYESDREPVEDFARNAKVLLSGIEPSDFIPAYSGIRPKLIPPLSPSVHAHGKGMADFVIETDPEFPCVVQLMGVTLSTHEVNAR